MKSIARRLCRPRPVWLAAAMLALTSCGDGLLREGVDVLAEADSGVVLDQTAGRDSRVPSYDAAGSLDSAVDATGADADAMGGADAAVQDAPIDDGAVPDVGADSGIATLDVDICVYGGTAAGVIAAYAAAKRGKKVVLIEPGRHLGGLSSGGLGWTDTGNTSSITGLAARFYKDVGAKYGKGTPIYGFEPHVAEELFDQYVADAGVDVLFQRRLKTVSKQGKTITRIRVEHSSQPNSSTDISIDAGVFIDATYEGDLMARAGVSYATGREANAKYGETINGVYITPPFPRWNLPDGIDPYVISGNASSGLLPGVRPGPLPPIGSGDKLIQAYNYRLCMTKNASNRLPVPKPKNYDPLRYELTGRSIQANPSGLSQLTDYFYINLLQHGKYDWNNRHRSASTDFIGGNWDYPDANYARRAELWQEHKEWMAGVFYFLATDPRVPATVKNELAQWGLCKDEFVDTDGWPHQLYVREARRMVGPKVMTENDMMNLTRIDDHVALGSYNMDSHATQRVVIGGMVKNEGMFIVRLPLPYRISYRAITPKASQCTNLLVPVCVSATHAAYGSIRMEPVFMALGQAAGVAAAMALDASATVQQVNVANLQQSLGVASVDFGLLMDSEKTSANGSVTLAGAWLPSSSIEGYIGKGYLHDDNASTAAKRVRFTPQIRTSGSYDVALRWTSHANRATNVPVAIKHSGGTAHRTVNQRLNGGTWVSLGKFNFAAGTSAYIEISNADTNGYVIIDALRLSRQ